MAKILNLLSGPRNVSTALMYSFVQRSDTAVVDEPLYGHYLRITEAPQPHWQEMIEVLPTDPADIISDTILSPPENCDLWFVKNMAHHIRDLDESFLDQCTNILLIRDPEQMLPSLINQIAEPTARDAAYADQARLFREHQESAHVIDARELLLDPRSVLSQLCERIGIAFDEAMLSWPAGPRPEDGPWAPYWYHNLHKSTGFAPYREKEARFPPSLEPLLAECRPHYLFLLDHAIRA